ncbi:surface carbohydrate biosynthesis protein [Bradyrhizobium cenepequi]
MLEQPHVCLIVDNPLRDLEGLVLLGRHLAIKGTRVTLVPMYEQGFDVPALRPDLVLMNYTRPNNADLIRSYKRAGILVGVLDTEGIGGKNADHFAELVKNTGCTDILDLYCVWGHAQHAAFLKEKTAAERIVYTTGCPRFDFCATPWRAALRTPSIPSGYVLINTNFPTANPRFSTGSAHEEDAIVKVGLTRDFARQFIADAGRACHAMLNMSISLAKHFADVQFVLRPHPFENIRFYDAFAELPNARVIQEGTSLEWINGARLLIHQNCSTAIEAAMLNVEPLSVEWFNTPALRLEAPTAVSRGAGSEADLIELVKQGLDGRLPPVTAQIEQARQEIIRDLYAAVDGASSSRVTDVVLRTIMTARQGERIAAVVPRPSARGIVAGAVRRTLGHKASSALRRGYGAAEDEQRRVGKAFTPDMVNLVLRRIDAASADGRHFRAKGVAGETRRMARTISGSSLQLTEAN